MANIPPLAILVTHAVADYDRWKVAFDKHQDARREAGVLGHHLNRSPGNEVAVYLPAMDRARLAAFLGSADLKATMTSAGVTSPPGIDWLKPVEDSHIADRSTAAMIVRHRVADFGAWKKVYDSVADLRRQHGIIGAAVNQLLDDPNMVVVYHQAETSAALEAFVGSSDLKAAMHAAGVSGPPEFKFYQSEPGARY